MRKFNTRVPFRFSILLCYHIFLPKEAVFVKVQNEFPGNYTLENEYDKDGTICFSYPVFATEEDEIMFLLKYC